MKKMAITGSTGFIAESIISTLKGYSFILIKREDFKGDVRNLYDKIKDADVIVNLAGAPIIKRWTGKNKEDIYNSRIKTTRKLVRAIDMMNKRIHLVSASAIGIYDDKNTHDETSTNFAEGFVRDLLLDWEFEAKRNQQDRSHLTIVRIGLVMSGRGGIIKILMPVFKMGIGGSIGNGRQYMSFIHMDDLVRAIDFILEKEINGVVNLTAPEPVTNKEFTRSFGKILRKPAFLKVPVFMLKLMFGKGAGMILASQHVTPAVLLNNGFEFRYPNIESTLKNIIEST